MRRSSRLSAKKERKVYVDWSDEDEEEIPQKNDDEDFMEKEEKKRERQDEEEEELEEEEKTPKKPKKRATRKRKKIEDEEDDDDVEEEEGEKEVTIRRLPSLAWQYDKEATLQHIPHDLLRKHLLRHLDDASLFSYMKVSTFTYHDAQAILTQRAKEKFGCEDVRTISCWLQLESAPSINKGEAKKMFTLSDIPSYVPKKVKYNRSYQYSWEEHLYKPRDLIKAAVARY